MEQMSATKYFKSTGRMSTRKSAPHEDNNEETFPSLDNLLTEITKMSATLQSVATDVSTIKETITELKIVVADMQKRIT